MDHIVHRVLRFDCFALDLARGCLRAGDQEIDLRPKTFEVLHYLAQNGGRLVPKQELFEGVWPNVSVCDDSLVQCIRELRQKLGDNDRRLIKTVSRRGYLLDVTVRAEAPPSCAGSAMQMPGLRQKLAQASGLGRRVPRTIAPHGLSILGIVVAGLLCVASIFLLPTSVADPSLVSRADSATGALGLRPTFKDCADCPEMVALPAGEFMMGSPKDERGRRSAEGLPRRVVIPKRIAIGKFEVTVDQFAAFAAETEMAVGNACQKLVRSSGGSSPWGPPEASFRQPGFEVSGSQPVVCISWHEAQAYVAWLSRRTGRPYRLPTEAEWEYASRAGTSTMYSFGDDETALCAYARFADLGSIFEWRGGCRSDTAAYGPLPVGSLRPNPWGIFDMHGNVWEWVEDCWTPNASDMPTDGSAFSRPDGCDVGVMRGGSWAAPYAKVRSATRWPARATSHYHHLGFRVALSLGE
jgi:formylglycine-generating enzyme required for sulfatase activity/DNA-binding winged helix-turn-helix (wHTH) protein